MKPLDDWPEPPPLEQVQRGGRMGPLNLRKLLDRFKKPKNDVKDFVNYIGNNEYLQTRTTENTEYANLTCYLQSLIDDIHWGVINPINFIEEVYGEDWVTPVDRNPSSTHLQVRGKKRILLLYYEFIEKDAK